MKPLLVSSGEPAGVGPDLCLALAFSVYPVVVMGDKHVLMQRARQLNLSIVFRDYVQDQPMAFIHGELVVCSRLCAVAVVAGELDPRNAAYVLSMLTEAGERCLAGEFSGLVTAPVQKSVINEAGFEFTGHTEFLASLCHVPRVVMMLACSQFKVALVTTHLPLRSVADAVTPSLLHNVIQLLHNGLQRDFGMEQPCIRVAGLNPHAGESGYLGREEIDVITPTLDKLRREGINVQGPFPADTLFIPEHFQTNDVFLAMYHDQGLPVLKYADFDHAVNVTLGLPIIRTSVDHGTALHLAGRGLAKSSSLIAAVDMALSMAQQREK
jgi:4-hydroxythreonine-4-phosphate dehydrogenase